MRPGAEEPPIHAGPRRQDCDVLLIQRPGPLRAAGSGHGSGYQGFGLVSLRAEEARGAGRRRLRGAGGDAAHGAGAGTENGHVLSAEEAQGEGAGYLAGGGGVPRRHAERLCYGFPDGAEAGRPCGVAAAARV